MHNYGIRPIQRTTVTKQSKVLQVIKDVAGPVSILAIAYVTYVLLACL